jgi:hypothetical protein
LGPVVTWTVALGSREPVSSLTVPVNDAVVGEGLGVGFVLGLQIEDGAAGEVDPQAAQAKQQTAPTKNLDMIGARQELCAAAEPITGRAASRA